jgi:serpin B
MRKVVFAIVITLIWPLAAQATASEGRTAVVRGSNRFAVDLYHRVRGEEGNLLMAPLSLYAAFGMTYGGARSRTAEEMADVLHVEIAPEPLHRELGSLLRDLESSAIGNRLQLANAVWPQSGRPLLAEFVRLCAESYGAQIESLDFENSTEGALRTINRWFADQTEERVPELLEPGDLAPATAIALTNVVHFRGEWLGRFEARFTEQAPFTLADGTQVEHALMHRSGRFGFFEDAELQVLELPYSGERLSMVVVLPRRHDGLPGIEEELSAGRLAELVGKLEQKFVRVALPRFTIATRLELSETLKEMGMSTAFEREADFSGITGARDLWIDLVVHGSSVELTEEGTEAAAGTAVVLKKGPGATEFRADHPFLFLIRDRLSGSILFLGRLEQPAQSEVPAASAVL